MCEFLKNMSSYLCMFSGMFPLDISEYSALCVCAGVRLTGEDGQGAWILRLFLFYFVIVRSKLHLHMHTSTSAELFLKFMLCKLTMSLEEPRSLFKDAPICPVWTLLYVKPLFLHSKHLSNLPTNSIMHHFPMRLTALSKIGV